MGIEKNREKIHQNLAKLSKNEETPQNSFLGVGVLMRKIGKPAVTVFLIVIIAALYFGAGKLGLAFAYFHASASPVWPAAGIALAALLFFGYRVLPGVFLGAFLVNATTSHDIPTSLGIACGNTLEALTGALLINRFAGGIYVFEKPERVFAFALSALFSTSVSPTIGVTSLALGGLAEWVNYWRMWLTWWMGDFSGVLILSPLLILWGTNPKINWEFQNHTRIIEASLAVTLLSVSAVLVFGGVLSRTQEYVQAFLTIPPLLWIAFRFSRDAIRDPLTGLSNRLLFLNQLEQCLKEHRNDEMTFAVLFFDVDRLKLINDSLGHQAGDELLIKIGKRINGVLRPEDIFSRISGDEFAILLKDIRETSDAEKIAEGIQMALKEPFLLSGQEVFISVSIGILLGNGTYQRPEDILRDADASMYRAKRLGRNRYVLFDREECDYPMDTLRMETDLRRALERKEMMIYYQPIYSLDSGELQSFEALIRWEHPRQGLLLPSEFIHLAEDCGTIWSLDRWVLRETCKQIRDWRKFHTDARTFPVSVNLSPRLFSQRDFVNEIEEILQDTELKGEDIQLEITERSFMEKQEEVAKTIRRLREMGIKILLDDFGIGFSSLSYLHRFPMDGVKIDRSFVAVMVEENQGRQVVYAMIQLAHALGLNVIAEGVETPEQLEALRNVECEYAQGYLLGYPMDKEATSIFIMKNGGSKLQHEIKLI